MKLNKLKIKGKKGTIGTMLSGVIAMFIISFIMLIFVIICANLAKNKAMNFQTKNVITTTGMAIDSDGERILITMLNSPIEIGNSQITFKDYVLSSLNKYFDARILEKLPNKDINNYYLSAGLDEALILSGIKQGDEQKLVDSIKSSLPKEKCIHYTLKIPLGTFYYFGKEVEYAKIYQKQEWDYFLSSTSLTIPYKNQQIKFEFNYKHAC